MKKISLLTLAIIAGLFIYAQEPKLRTPAPVQTRFGIKAGANLATLEIDDESSTNEIGTNNKTSLHAGIFVNIPLGDKFRVQPELVYSKQGSKVSYSGFP